MSSTETTTCSLRNDTEKFKTRMNQTFENNKKDSIILVGVSACETANLFKDHIFYEYDLSLCTKEKNVDSKDDICNIRWFEKNLNDMYKKNGSPVKNIAVFRHLETLTGNCDDIARMNLVLVTMFEGPKFQDINVLLLYEENLPQTPENCFQNIDQYIQDQYNLTLNCEKDDTVNLNAFFGRLVPFYVEQGPRKTECKLEIDNRKPTLLSNFSIPVILIIIVMMFVCLKSNKKKNKSK